MAARRRRRPCPMEKELRATAEAAQEALDDARLALKHAKAGDHKFAAMAAANAAWSGRTAERQGMLAAEGLEAL